MLVYGNRHSKMQEGGGPATAAATACSKAIGTAVAVAITSVTTQGSVKGTIRKDQSPNFKYVRNAYCGKR
jgi:hypothetical protein